MSVSRQVSGKSSLGHRRQRLSVIAALVAALLMAIGIAANPALAATARTAHPAIPSSQTANPSSGPSAVKIPLPSFRFSDSAKVQYKSGAVNLSTAQCAAIRAALQRAHAGPMNACRVAVGVVLRRVNSVQDSAPQATSASGTWYTFEEQATTCWGDNTALWNGPNGSASCKEGYFGISDEFASNGSWLNLHWENPYFATTTDKITLTREWVGVSGNNTADMTVGDDYNYSDLLGTGSAGLRIYNGACGVDYVCEQAQAWWTST